MVLIDPGATYQTNIISAADLLHLKQLGAKISERRVNVQVGFVEEGTLYTSMAKVTASAPLLEGGMVNLTINFLVSSGAAQSLIGAPFTNFSLDQSPYWSPNPSTKVSCSRAGSNEGLRCFVSLHTPTDNSYIIPIDEVPWPASPTPASPQQKSAAPARGPDPSSMSLSPSTPTTTTPMESNHPPDSHPESDLDDAPPLPLDSAACSLREYVSIHSKEAFQLCGILLTEQDGKPSHESVRALIVLVHLRTGHKSWTYVYLTLHEMGIHAEVELVKESIRCKTCLLKRRTRGVALMSGKQGNRKVKVEDFSQTSLNCKFYSGTGAKMYVPSSLLSLYPSAKPGEHLACDTVYFSWDGNSWELSADPESVSDVKSMTISIIVDRISLYVSYLIIPSKLAVATADHLRRWTRHVGRNPVTVRTDNGSEYKADFARLVLSLGAIHETIVPGEPENNPAERQAREIRESLEIFARDFWVADHLKSNFVQSAELCHNITVSPSRGASPWALLHGSPRSPKAPQV